MSEITRYFETTLSLPEYMRKPPTDEQDIKSGKEEVLEVDIYYSLGGVSIWNGQQQRRGIFMGFQPMIKDGAWKKMVLGDGRSRKILLKEMPRKNKKVAEKIVDLYIANRKKLDPMIANGDYPQVMTELHAALKEEGLL